MIMIFLFQIYEKQDIMRKKLIILSIFSMIIIDTELNFSVYTHISTSYRMIYHTLL